MKYFFFALNESCARNDQVGEEFASEKDAISYAGLIAKEIMEEGGYDELTIVVVNETGKEIGKVALPVRQ